MNNPREDVNHVFGLDTDLKALLSREALQPLLEAARGLGASYLAVSSVEGSDLAAAGDAVAGEEEAVFETDLRNEGEPVAVITLRAPGFSDGAANALLRIVYEAVRVLLESNRKRLLTTDIHTAVVRQSYTELLETNRRLRESEKRYRELSEHLEEQVRERSAELEATHARLLQQEKMASVGQLAAGVAHEINNPLGFISSNLNTLGRYAEKLSATIDDFRSAAKTELPEPIRKDLETRYRTRKLDFVLKDIPELIEQSRTGAERVAGIVADLKGFSHVDDEGERPVNLNEEIDRTLSVLRHEIPSDAIIEKQYRELPPVSCRPALMGQALLSLVTNAFEACPKGLRMRIETCARKREVELLFTDNGPGIPDEIRDRVFEPFFTTKQVGQGTGMGLTVAYDIVRTGGGTLTVENEPDGGACFRLRLPVESHRD